MTCPRIVIGLLGLGVFSFAIPRQKAAIAAQRDAAEAAMHAAKDAKAKLHANQGK